jgi:hypothetical protein
MQRAALIVLAVAGLAAQLGAQIRITGLDGLAAKAKETVDINLDETTLKNFAEFMGPEKGQDSEKLKAAVAGLKSLIVKSFEFDKPGQYRMEDVNAIREQLRAPGWNKILSSVEDGEIAEIYTRTEEGRMVGLAIVAAEPTELTIVIIDGTIRLSDLGALGNLGVPGLPGSDSKQTKKEE